jgi:hypothetical protein
MDNVFNSAFLAEVQWRINRKNYPLYHYQLSIVLSLFDQLYLYRNLHIFTHYYATGFGSHIPC